MKRILAIVVTLVLLVSFAAVGFADSNECCCGCPYCCNQLYIKVKSTFKGTVWIPINNGLIVGVKNHHEEKFKEFKGFIGVQKDWTRKLKIPDGILGNGKCRRVKAWAEIDMSSYLGIEAWKDISMLKNLKIDGMTKFEKVTISIKSEYASRVEHAVRSFFAVNFGIPYHEVIMNTENISLALLDFYSVSDSVCTCSDKFFTSDSFSEVCGNMKFEDGELLDIKIGYFDDDDIEDIGLVPGVPVTKKTDPDPEPVPAPTPEPEPKPQQKTNSSKSTSKSCNKTTTAITVNVNVNNVVNKVVGLFNKVTTIIQNQVGTGCNNKQTVTVPGCK